jgi:glutamate-1-semialdehyde 2,1-aminomutase
MLTSILRRLQLSSAKHRSLHGHARISKRLARLVPFYEYGPERFFAADGAPFEVAERRRSGFARLAHTLSTRAPRTLAATEAAGAISDLQFTGRYRVPFQFRRLVAEQLRVGSFLDASAGVRVRDLDGNVPPSI